MLANASKNAKLTSARTDIFYTAVTHCNHALIMHNFLILATILIKLVLNKNSSPVQWS